MASGTLDGTGWTVLQCNSLNGSGTLSDPYRLGVITGPLEVQNCLTPASGAVDADFLFTMPNNPGTGAYAGASTDLALGGDDVNPSILTPQGAVLLSQPPNPPPVQGVASNQCGPWFPVQDPALVLCATNNLGAGSYVLHEGRDAPFNPGQWAYALWINPNYTDAQRPLYPPLP